ncbi:hypothetical protein [Labilibacter marinus]|uniref:hypothetical protein n=1 Tax=Labilibacter marinus TaxID=1477105 RepID=UPI0009501C32|nr:hypothetical protein [Labilibacter marinus]
MNTHSFNPESVYLAFYASIFMKIVIAVILVYVFVIIVNFLRDKFLSKEQISSDPQIIDLVNILQKLFYFSGFGFVLGNIFQVVLSAIVREPSEDWSCLCFGLILIFMGIGFKASIKILTKNKEENN